MFNLVEINKVIEREKFLQTTLVEDRKIKKKLDSDIEDLEECKAIFSRVLVTTRSEFIRKLSTIITPVLQHIFEGRNFVFDIIEKNNSYLSVIREGKEVYVPKYEKGGGLISILSVSLKIAFLELSGFRKVIFIDELFSNLGIFAERAMESIRFLSINLKIQFIILTHDYSLLEYADKKWEVSYKNNKSTVVELTD